VRPPPSHFTRFDIPGHAGSDQGWAERCGRARGKSCLRGRPRTRGTLGLGDGSLASALRVPHGWLVCGACTAGRSTTAEAPSWPNTPWRTRRAHIPVGARYPSFSLWRVSGNVCHHARTGLIQEVRPQCRGGLPSCNGTRTLTRMQRGGDRSRYPVAATGCTSGHAETPNSMSEPRHTAAKADLPVLSGSPTAPVRPAPAPGAPHVPTARQSLSGGEPRSAFRRVAHKATAQDPY
jgi:hypothetical protein